jgi:hypothetical protein
VLHALFELQSDQRGIATMEPAVYFSAPHAATVPSTLVTSFVGRANVPMDGRARSDGEC